MARGVFCSSAGAKPARCVGHPKAASSASTEVHTAAVSEPLFIDFETRSAVDLRKTGVYVYAKDETTDLWCVCYAHGNGPIETWVPDHVTPGRGFFADVTAHVGNGGLIVAHNANFERVIWDNILTPRYGWPKPKMEQWRCTMTQCYAMALPGKLEDALPAAGIDHAKDMTGHRLMQRMCRPRKVSGDGTITWWDDAERIGRLIEYCKSDVIGERLLYDRLRPLKDSELELWFLDQRINDRGVFVDKELADAAKCVVADCAEGLDADIRAATKGAVSRCSNRNQIVQWVRERGVDVTGIAKSDIEDLLERDNLPTDVRSVLDIRRRSAKASVAKIDTLLRGTCPDGRARGLLQFHAAGTGRWAGRRFQPQNLKRPDLELPEQVDEAIDLIMDGDAEMIEAMYGEPLAVVGDTIRGMIKAPPGKKIIAADYAAIEGRVLAWLADETWKIQAYRDGVPIYETTAAKCLNKKLEDVTKLERQNYGKVPELACGYQGGMGAFKKMAITFGVELEDAEVKKIVADWREANPSIREFWYALDAAAMQAVTKPGSTQWVDDKIVFRVAGSFLWMRLPSKRFLAYAYPEIAPKKMPWLDERTGEYVVRDAVSYKGVNSYTRKWERCWLYGGLLAENATQAVSRDFMAAAMPELEKAGYPIILTVHDEIVAEPDEDFGSAEEMVSIMKVLPEWGLDCPIEAEGWEGARYRK